jgi:hypothetical protein
MATGGPQWERNRVAIERMTEIKRRRARRKNLEMMRKKLEKATVSER